MPARQAVHLQLAQSVQKLNEFDEHKIPDESNMYMQYGLKIYKSLIKCFNQQQNCIAMSIKTFYQYERHSHIRDTENSN